MLKLLLHQTMLLPHPNALCSSQIKKLDQQSLKDQYVIRNVLDETCKEWNISWDYYELLQTYEATQCHSCIRWDWKIWWCQFGNYQCYGNKVETVQRIAYYIVCNTPRIWKC